MVVVRPDTGGDGLGGKAVVGKKSGVTLRDTPLLRVVRRPRPNRKSFVVGLSVVRRLKGAEPMGVRLGLVVYIGP